MAGPLALGPLRLRAHALLPGSERRFTVGELGLQLVEARAGDGLAFRDRLGALLEPCLDALVLELGCAEVALARAGGLVAGAERVLLRDRVRSPLVELGALALELTLPLGEHPELPRQLRGGLGPVVIGELEVGVHRVDLDSELGKSRLLGNELGPVQIHLAPLVRNLLELIGKHLLAPLELALARRDPRRRLLGLRLAERQITRRLEIVLADLDLVLQRIAQVLLAPQRSL